ncbi:MAG: glycosyltransferase involved in cell wall biosynthesis, partial [Dokdonia sp.]
EGWIKKHVSNSFYKIIESISDVDITPNAGDFRLMDRKVVNEVIKLRETSRFMKGVFSFPGFSKSLVTFQVQPRHSGSSKWNMWKLWNFSLDGLFGFSTLPLRAWSYLGLVVFLFSFSYLIFELTKAIFFGIDTPGYTTTITLILFFGSIQLISIGVLGEYIGRIFEQSQNRPLYIVDEFIDLTQEEKQ